MPSLRIASVKGENESHLFYSVNITANDRQHISNGHLNQFRQLHNNPNMAINDVIEHLVDFCKNRSAFFVTPNGAGEEIIYEYLDNTYLVLVVRPDRGLTTAYPVRNLASLRAENPPGSGLPPINLPDARTAAIGSAMVPAENGNAFDTEDESDYDRMRRALLRNAAMDIAKIGKN